MTSAPRQALTTTTTVASTKQATAPVTMAATANSMETTVPVTEVLAGAAKPKDVKEATKKTTAKRARKEIIVDSTTVEPGTDGEKDKPESGSPNVLIVAKSVRNFLKALPNSCHCGAEALPTLNIRVTELLREASTRAHANSRKTLKSCDF